MFQIKYNITITLQNLINKEMKQVIQPCIKTIPIDDKDIYKLFNTIYYIDTINVKDLAIALLQNYITANSLTLADVDIEEYTITSETENVEVYFENNENNNEYTLSPSIMAKILPNDITYEKPTLYGELVDNYSIKWSVNHIDSLKYRHILLDEYDNVIANIPLNEDSYTEFNLEHSTVYARKVIKANDYGMSKASDVIHVKTNPLIIETDLHQYKEESSSDYNQVQDEVINDNLKAFQSGIGDGLDVFTEKQTEGNFNENCNLYISIFGYYEELVKKYRQTGFSYRVKVNATRTVNEREGFLKFKAAAYPIEQVKFIVVKMAQKPVDIQYEVRAYVNFYKQSGDGTYLPATKVISYKGEDTKYQVIDPIPEKCKKVVSGNRTVKDMVRGAIESDAEIQASMTKMANASIPVSLTKTSLDFPSNVFPDTLSFDKDGYHYELKKHNSATRISGTTKSIPVNKKVYYRVGDYYINDPNSAINNALDYKIGYGQWKYLCTMPIDLYHSNGSLHTIDHEYKINKSAPTLAQGCVKTTDTWQNIIPITDSTIDGVPVSLPSSIRNMLNLSFDPNDSNCLKDVRSVFGSTAAAFDYPDYKKYDNFDVILVRTYTAYLILTGEVKIKEDDDFYKQEYRGTKTRIGEELSLGYYVDHYEIWDNYQFDMIEIYNSKLTRKWNRGEYGSVKTCANYLNNDMVDPNSYVYAWGWSDGCMYTARSDNEITVEFDSSWDEYPIVKKSDLTLGKSLKNICGDVIPENSTDVDIMTVVEWTFIDKHILITDFYDTNKVPMAQADGTVLKVTMNKVSDKTIIPDDICVAQIAKAYITPTDNALTYEFTEQYPQNFIVFDDLFDIEFDANRKYKYTIDVIDCSDNISISTNNNSKIVKVGDHIQYNGYYSNYSIPVAAAYKDIKRKYTQTYPDPIKNEDPLYGIVNGRFSEHNPSGKEDLSVTLPKLALPSDIDDGTLDISLSIEDVIVYDENNNVLDYDNGFINYKFKHEIKSNTTRTNGDVVRFFSDYGENLNEVRRELIKTVNSNKIFLNSLDSYTETIRVYKPAVNKEYNRYTLSLICDNSDVRIINYPADDVDFNTVNYVDIPVELKGDFSSTSMWHPKVHNGYYYINQKEYFLYSDFRVWNPTIYIKNNSSNEKKLLGIPQYTLYDVSQFFKLNIASYTIKATVKKDIYFKAVDVIKFKEKSDFINTFKHQKFFEYNQDTNKVQCLPVLVDTKYFKKYKDTDTYFSAIRYSPNTIKHIGKVSFDSSDYSYVSMYIRYYDNITCKWSSWIAATNNIDLNLDVDTNNIQYKFDVKNNIMYKDTVLTETTCCTLQYLREIDNGQSFNVSLSENKIHPKTNDIAKYMSLMFDYGTDDTQVVMYAHKRGLAKIQIGSMTDKGDFTRFNDIMLNCKTAGRKFIYTVDMYDSNDKILQIYKTISTKTNDTDNSTLGDFGNVQITCTTEDYSKTTTIEKEYSTRIVYNTDWHYVTGSVWEALTNEINDNGYDITDVVALSLTNNGITTELSFENANGNTANIEYGSQIKARSKVVEYEEATKNEYITFKDNKVILYPKPQQYCPVTIEDTKVGVLKQVHFTDKLGNPSLTNIEKLIADNNNVFALKFSDIKLDTVIVTVDGNPIATTDYVIDSNLLKFDYIVDKGKEIKIEYQIKNSFVVDYKYDITTDPLILATNNCFKYNTVTGKYDIPDVCNLGSDDSIQFNSNDRYKYVIIKTNVKDDEFGRTKICYESNINDNRAIQKHLGLNPVFNMYNEGFMYISYNDNAPSKLNLHANPTKIKGNGKEITKIYAQVLDKEGNPVVNEPLAVSCVYGKIIVENNITDVNGIVSFIYLSYTPKNDIIDVQCNVNTCKNTINITVI